MDSPLNSAARVGGVAMIRYLVDHGADVNLHTPTNNTPLTSAIKSFNPEVVKLLLEEGANPNLPRSSDYFPPLNEVIRSINPLTVPPYRLDNMFRILELLFKYGVDDANW